VAHGVRRYQHAAQLRHYCADRRARQPQPSCAARSRLAPDIVFNLLEEFDGIVTYDQHVVAFLELMRQPYTGCNPRGLLLCVTSPLKQLLAFHRIATPQFAVFGAVRAFSCAAQAAFPAVREIHGRGRILGIAQASVVEMPELKERIEFVPSR